MNDTAGIAEKGISTVLAIDEAHVIGNVNRYIIHVWRVDIFGSSLKDVFNGTI